MSPARKDPDLDTYRGRFAARLKHLREKAGLSVDDVAEVLIEKGVIKNSGTIYHWESGKTIPKVDNFPDIANLYKVKPRNLLPLE